MPWISVDLSVRKLVIYSFSFKNFSPNQSKKTQASLYLSTYLFPLQFTNKLVAIKPFSVVNFVQLLLHCTSPINKWIKYIRIHSSYIKYLNKSILLSLCHFILWHKLCYKSYNPRIQWSIANTFVFWNSAFFKFKKKNRK